MANFETPGIKKWLYLYKLIAMVLNWLKHKIYNMKQDISYHFVSSVSEVRRHREYLNWAYRRKSGNRYFFFRPRRFCDKSRALRKHLGDKRVERWFEQAYLQSILWQRKRRKSLLSSRKTIEKAAFRQSSKLVQIFTGIYTTNSLNIARVV